MKIYYLSKKKAREIYNKIIETWPSFELLDKLINIKIFELEKNKNLIIFPTFKIISNNDFIIPSLNDIQIIDKFPFVEVDQGAIRFICKGADIMRPGIVNYNNFKKNDIVAVKEIIYKKYICIGNAIVNSSDIENINHGKIVKNLHYVGDIFWKTMME